MKAETEYFKKDSGKGPVENLLKDILKDSDGLSVEVAIKTVDGRPKMGKCSKSGKCTSEKGCTENRCTSEKRKDSPEDGLSEFKKAALSGLIKAGSKAVSDVSDKGIEAILSTLDGMEYKDRPQVLAIKKLMEYIDGNDIGEDDSLLLKGALDILIALEMDHLAKTMSDASDDIGSLDVEKFCKELDQAMEIVDTRKSLFDD